MKKVWIVLTIATAAGLSFLFAGKQEKHEENRVSSPTTTQDAPAQTSLEASAFEETRKPELTDSQRPVDHTEPAIEDAHPESPGPESLAPSPVVPDPETKSGKGILNRLKQAYDPEDESKVKSLLSQEAQIKNFSYFRKQSQDIKAIDAQNQKAIQGRFKGQLEVSAQSNEVWELETDIQWNADANGHYNGNYEIILTSNQKGRISRTAGSGAANSIRMTEDQQGLILEISPTMFVHVMYLENADLFTGNVYTIEQGEQSRYVGPIILKRQ